MKLRSTALALLALIPAAALLAQAPVAAPAPAPAPVADSPETATRKAQIIANLKLRFPELAQVPLSLEGFTPVEGVTGMEQGTMVINTPQGPQRHAFLVDRATTRFFALRFDPVDVSKDAQSAAAEVAKKDAETRQAEMEKSKSVRGDLEAMAKGLPVRGNPNAKITIYEFSDFQCPYCSRGAATVEAVLKENPDVNFVFMHYPLDFHPWAKPAAIASHCAGQQSPELFWKLHDGFFANQSAITLENVSAKAREWIDASVNADAKLKKAFSADRWTACATQADSAEYAAAAKTVADQMALGQKYGVQGTPGFFVNGRRVEGGAVPPEAFKPLLDDERKAAPATVTAPAAGGRKKKK